MKNPTAGNIGQPQREIELEPLEEPIPEPITVPEPERTPV
jgi:hypothetical protein